MKATAKILLTNNESLKLRGADSYKKLKCVQIEKRKMEIIEGWDPHPTRKNIFRNQEDGLLKKG